MGAIRLIVMLAVIGAGTAWALGQNGLIDGMAQDEPRDVAKVVDKSMAEEMARKLEAFVAEYIDQRPRVQKPVPESDLDSSRRESQEPDVQPVARRQIQIPDQAQEADPRPDQVEASDEIEEEEPVVVARAGSTTGQGVDDHTPIRGMRLRANRDGHFYLEVQVNGARIPFLVDTGASSVMLTREAARRARINPRRGDYTMKAQTANGMVRMAPVTVRDMRIGQFRTTNVRGAVNRADSGISLLGMSFLSRLSRYEVKGNELILYW